ncbi:MAG: DsbE family thiol:disulfide interchange protein [Alphaproteobacteria bacterium]
MKLSALIPLGIFAAIAVALFVGLSLNPRDIPSALIGKPVPEFSLPPLAERGDDRRLGAADLKTGETRIVNIFASWCGPCREEHPQLMDLQARGVVVHGINYKDVPANAADFLVKLGDPYDKVGVDRTGRVSIDFGVYGVPETYIISGDGRVLYKHVGPLTTQDVAANILPLLGVGP